jgi:1-deoxy-D-xylulose-5-phosphate reductoisomerase
VEAFLEGRIGYLSIYEIVQETLSRMSSRTPRTVGDILEIDRQSRAKARELTTARAAGIVTA